MSFALLETMRAEGGAVALLARHCERLGRSAQHFGFICDLEGIRATIEQKSRQTSGTACLRLLLEQNGTCLLETRPMPTSAPSRLQIASIRVDSHDSRLYHKTTERGLYESARKDLNEDTDAILVNERGEATETTIANFAVFRNGLWTTPPVSCGLLPGVMRADLLDRGEIVEGVIPVESLVAGETARCFNALRGLFETRIQR